MVILLMEFVLTFFSGQLRTFLIQVCIHANHQNGKDTHVRGLQIFSLEP